MRAYENGVRKALYRDPDGNEIGFAGADVGEMAGPGSKPKR
jgi:hypothetical protein